MPVSIKCSNESCGEKFTSKIDFLTESVFHNADILNNKIICPHCNTLVSLSSSYIKIRKITGEGFVGKDVT